MPRSIELIWWATLGVALVATVVVVKQVALILEALRGIHVLAEATRDAARGIATNVRAVERLPELVPPLTALRSSTGEIAASVASIGAKLQSVIPARMRGGS